LIPTLERAEEHESRAEEHESRAEEEVATLPPLLLYYKTHRFHTEYYNLDTGLLLLPFGHNNWSN
jgi:hypothetical protein